MGGDASGSSVRYLKSSMQIAKEWYASPAYAEALKLRASALERRLIFVEGVAL